MVRVMREGQPVDYIGSGSSVRGTSALQQLIKRCFDLTVSFSILLLFSPLVVFVFLLTKLLSPHSTIYRLHYYDLNGRPFEVFQFRPSIADADRKMGPSVPWIDQFLDRSSFNDILLLINVLWGDMSLVGPRPLSKSWAVIYQLRLPATYLRGVRPGLVSLGRVREIEDTNSANEKLCRNIDDDFYYLANRSLWFDLKILFLAIFSGRT